MLINQICLVPSLKRFSCFAALVFVLLMLIGCSGKFPDDTRQKTVEATNFRVERVELAYRIDKSAVPAISFYDMTYTHKIGDSQSLTVFGDGKSVPFSKRTNDEIVFTSDASLITITLNDISLTNNLGTLSPTALKHDKAWAWSHSLDDNTYLEESIRLFESYGYRGLIYLIVRDVWPDRNEDWILDEPDLHRLLTDGWSVGNHTWAHDCHKEFDYVKSITDGQVRMQEVIENSARPSYKLTAFSAPCFDQSYHPIILEMRNNQTSDVQFNESGVEHLLRVDDVYSETITVDGRRISGFNFDLPIGRDISFEENPSRVLDTFDWIATKATSKQHYWYNTFSHGNREDTVRMVLDHIDKNYARNGTDEVWIAPADEIYSYFLLREKMVISNNINVTTTVAPRQPVAQAQVVEQLPALQQIEQQIEQQAQQQLAQQQLAQQQIEQQTQQQQIEQQIEQQAQQQLAQQQIEQQTQQQLVQQQIEQQAQQQVEQQVEPIAVAPIKGNIRIEVAHQSGVAGFPFSIFGDGFGQVQHSGSVTINNVTAEITNWQNGVIEGIVPQTADGNTTLTVTNSEGKQASNKFVVYSINPQFLQPITQTFRDVAHGKRVFTTKPDDASCNQQPDDISIQPARFLTDYRCGYAGYARVGDAIFSADAERGIEATIAVDTEQTLQGDYIFQFFSRANWYPSDDRKSYPKDYVIEISADSTNGKNGRWQIVHQQTNNDRATRLHAVTIPNGDYSWVRLRVTDSNGDVNDKFNGKDFSIREIRFYETSGSDNVRPATYAVMGDSLTADAFELIGPMGFSERLKNINGDNNDVILSSLGLSGIDSAIFESFDWLDVDMYDAFAQDNMGQQIRFWGIGIGTNDAGSGSGQLSVTYSNISQFDDRLAQIIPVMIAQGNVPLIARLPAASLEWGFGGDLAAMKKLLADIDAISARYQLVPGPDFYTPFRKNITYQNSSFIREGDGIHHTELGYVELVSGWANAFARIPFGGASINQHTVSQQSSTEIPGGCNNQGLKMVVWDDVQGDVIGDLTSHPTYPNSPTREQSLEAFETTSIGNQFGALINGYLTVPVTGSYTFWVAGDDTAELWLSTDASRENLQRIAQAPGWTGSQEWDRFEEQQSSELMLEAGQRYYIEALWKDSFGGDYMSVAWETPISERAILGGEYLCTP